MIRFFNWLESKIPQDAIIVDLPKVEQTKNSSCGAAALRACCNFFGVGPEDEESYIQLLRSDSDGTKPINIIRVARQLGLHAYGRQHMTVDTLKTRLSKRIPVICAVQAWGSEKWYEECESGHYVVAIGFDDKKIYFEDPSMKKTRGFLPYEEFLRRWYDKDKDGNKYVRFGIALWKRTAPKETARKDTAHEIQ